MTPAPDAENDTRKLQQQGEDECGPYTEQERISMVDWEKRARELMLQNCNLQSNDVSLYPRFANLEERLRSYRNWPAGTGVTPEALSQAGLFYSSHGDRTLCFQCGGSLEGWCVSDNPLTEHAKWYPSCKFISSLRNNLVIDNSYVEDFLKKARAEDDMKAAIKTIQDLVSSIDINKVNPCGMRSVIETLKIIVSEVDSNQENSRIQEVGKNEGKLDSIACDETPESSSSGSSISCVICLTGPRNALLLPCHHIATCISCASKLKTCCVCRLPVTYHTRVYIS